MQALELGISQEELREEVVERAATKLAKHLARQEGIADPVREVVQKIVTEVVNRVADEEVRPWVERDIESFVLQATNEWGEKRGEPMSFRQYVVDRAQHYLSEPVNFDGKSRTEAGGSYGFKASQTRIAHMVDKHLHYRIESAMKDALQSANDQLAQGIAETVQIKLAEIQESLKVSVTTKGR